MKMKLFVIVLFSLIVPIWTKISPLEKERIDSNYRTVKKEGRIVGGEPANAGQFPFMAAITVQTNSAKFFCGGALITNQWVLTAGHCVYGAFVLTIRLGSNSLKAEDPNRVTIATSHVVAHPEFNPETLENDVGLAKFRLPVELTDYIQPIGLATVELPTGAVSTAAGWGQTSNKNPDLSSQLNFVNLAVLSNTECRFIYGNQITDNMVCVEGNYNEGSCIGDSGSPLVANLNEDQVLEHVGVSSFYSAKGCETTDPSGYTRTYPYIDWIKNITATA